MEYEFRRNSLTGTYLASFSMDHEVLGQWFSEELGPELAKIQQVLDIIKDIQAGKRDSWRLIGGDLTLELDEEQARIYANALGFEQEYELEEAMSLYDAESEAYCGLEDLEEALLSWYEFVQKGR
ncbi:YacL family protein [Shewanella bicestrii]